MSSRERGRVSTGTLTGTALLLALGVVLPIVFHAIPLGGRIFLPMHLPTFIAGLVLGPTAGLVVGAGSPVASALLTGRPTVLYMVPMVFELATYGVVAGLLRRKFGAMFRGRTAGAVLQTPLSTVGSGGEAQEPAQSAFGSAFAAIPLALLCAMLAGRLVWIAVAVWLAPVIGLTARTPVMAFAAVGAGWIGMVIQIALIPPIVRAIERVRNP
ncbi:MAG: ECF transporter S component [Armatimonadetes bacterium]|nr:ECF transporter S component [Armatimonadota bacterium]